MTQPALHSPIPGARSPSARSSALLTVESALRILALWVRRSRNRRHFARMAERYPRHLLEDVGLSRADLLREAAKPFWRP